MTLLGELMWLSKFSMNILSFSVSKNYLGNCNESRNGVGELVSDLLCIIPCQIGTNG